MSSWDEIERIDTIVIGGGQAGLAVGYWLKRGGVPFLILDASNRVGDAWRARWDSLRLFTPARFDALPGLPFPAHPDTFPTKDEMADYLEAYAAHFELPVRCGMRVERVRREGGRFRVSAADREFEADNLVVAMASYQQPRVPAFAAELSSDIVQLHSAEYRKPSQLKEGGVLLVGAGNSGSEIAMELARSHRIWMSGRNTGEIPFRIDGFLGRTLLGRLVLRGLFHRVLTVATPIGRRVRKKILTAGGPLIRVKQTDLDAAGVERVPRMAGVRDGRPVLEDGRVLETANVIWCTGFEPRFSWIDLPVHGPLEPRHAAGIVETEPGLYFVGLHFLYSMSSTMIHGVGRDAKRIADAIARRPRQVPADRPGQIAAA